jgi:8-oxo-dGTP pyrophosphatase MutT (NUDIX family)
MAPPDQSPERSTDRPVIVAAGGVVRDGAGRAGRVLVVHRPAYDDWTLPKGHVDAGEDAPSAALREVLEETGIRARLVSTLPSTEHAVGHALKRVHWFLMCPTEEAGAPIGRGSDGEVDAAEWWPFATAAERLTYASERALLVATADV